MMKTKIFIALIYTFFFLNSNAQVISYDITSSKTYSVKAKEAGYSIEKIGEDESSYYYIQAAYQGSFVSTIKYTLLKFDKNLNLVLKKQIILPSSIENVFLIDNRLIILCNDYQIKTRRHAISYESINKETLELNNDKEEICTYKEIAKEEYMRSSNKVVISDDKSHFVVFSTSLAKSLKPLVFSFRIFTNEFDIIGENTNLESKFEHGTFNYESISLANDGSLFAVSKIRYKSDSQSPKVDIHQASNSEYYNYENEKGKYQVYYYSKNGQLIEYINLDLSNNTIRNVNISKQDDQRVYCYGLYTGLGKLSSKGSFILA